MGNLFTSSGIIGEAVTVSTKFWGISPSYSRWTPVSVSHKSNSSTLYYSEEKQFQEKFLSDSWRTDHLLLPRAEPLLCLKEITLLVLICT